MEIWFVLVDCLRLIVEFKTKFGKEFPLLGFGVSFRFVAPGVKAFDWLSSYVPCLERVIR